jgi:hypothetical protein
MSLAVDATFKPKVGGIAAFSSPVFGGVSFAFGDEDCSASPQVQAVPNFAEAPNAESLRALPARTADQIYQLGFQASCTTHRPRPGERVNVTIRLPFFDGERTTNLSLNAERVTISDLVDK